MKSNFTKKFDFNQAFPLSPESMVFAPEYSSFRRKNWVNPLTEFLKNSQLFLKRSNGKKNWKSNDKAASSPLFLTLLLFFVLTASPNIAFSQTSSNTFEVNGRIIDTQTKQVLPGALITNRDGSVGTVSTIDGTFSIPEVSSSDTLFVRFLGYKTERLVPSTRPKTITLTPDSNDLNEVIITGFDTRRRKLESPQSVGIIGELDFARHNRASLARQFEAVAGVQLRENDPLRQEINIRGVGGRQAGSGSARIKFYWNDIPINGVDGSIALFNINPNNIGSVEIIKGPASSIFGATTGGVVNIKTELPSYSDRSIEVENLSGSYGLQRNSTALRFSDDKVNVFANFGRQSFGGFMQNSDFQNDYITLNADFFVSNRVRTSLLVNNIDMEAGMGGLLSRTQFEEDPTQLGLNFQRFAQKNTIAGFSTEADLANNLTNITTVFAKFGTNRNQFFQRLGPPGTPVNNVVANNLAYGIRSRFIFNHNIGEKTMRWIGGYEGSYSYSRFMSYSNLTPTPPGSPIIPPTLGGIPLIDRVDELSQNILFLQAELDLSPRTMVTVGVSANDAVYESLNLRTSPNPEQELNPAVLRERAFDWLLTPRIGINHRVSERVAVYGSINSGYNLPSLAEITTLAGGFSDDLLPETSINYEIGSRGTIFGNLFYDVSFYHTTQQNEILQRFDPQGFTFRENAGTTRYRGLDIELSYNMISEDGFFTRIRPYTAISILDARFTDFILQSRPPGPPGGEIIETDVAGNYVTGSTPFRMFTGIDFQTRMGAYLHLTHNHTGKMALNDVNSDFTDPFNLINAKIGYAFNLGRLAFDLNFGLDNILDERYSGAPFFNAPDQGQGGLFFNPSLPRNWYTGASVRFNF